MNFPELTVAILVYNDVSALKSAIPKSLEVLDGLGISYEILIIEDASFDGSYEAALEFARDPRISLNHSNIRRGKGGALKDAILDSHGEIFCFYDVDLSTDLRDLPELISKIKDGADIAIGSRMISGSQVIRKGKRKITSSIFNNFVRFLLKSKINDHQCGFKAFNKDKLMKIIPYVSSKKWTWDTEVLVLAQRYGYNIVEIPVKWTQTDKTNLRVKDVFGMGLDVMKFAVKLRNSQKCIQDNS